MKLNPDCIRDILSSIEEVTDYHRCFEYDINKKPPALLEKYSSRDIQYHIRQCHMSGLIIDYEPSFGGGYISISDLSPDGHEFLANIRKSTIWEGVKGVAIEIGADSLSSLAEIARQAVFALIKKHFGIT